MMSNHFNLEDSFNVEFFRDQIRNWSSVQAVVYKTHFPYVVCTINGGKSYKFVQRVLSKITYIITYDTNRWPWHTPDFKVNFLISRVKYYEESLYFWTGMLCCFKRYNNIIRVWLSIWISSNGIFRRNCSVIQDTSNNILNHQY